MGVLGYLSQGHRQVRGGAASQEAANLRKTEGLPLWCA